MYQFPIGVMLDSFRLETKEAVKKAVGVGAKGLQMYVTKGEYAPENLSPAKRRELLDIVKSNGLVFSALCGDRTWFWEEGVKPHSYRKIKKNFRTCKRP